MGAPVSLLYVIARHVGIDLGRRHIGVSEQTLHAAQIGAAGQQVGREGMPQLVGVDAAADSSRSRVPPDDLPEPLAREPATPGRRK